MNALVKNQEENCAFIIYDVVPEFVPYFALRRDKHYKTKGTKIIKCPYCGDILTVVEVTTKLDLIRYPRKAKIDCQQSISCKFCRKPVGIVYASA